MKYPPRFPRDRNSVRNLRVRPSQRTLRLSCPVCHGDHLNTDRRYHIWRRENNRAGGSGMSEPGYPCNYKDPPFFPDARQARNR